MGYLTIIQNNELRERLIKLIKGEKANLIFLFTYAHVFDWFVKEHGIVIILHPFYTAALNGNIAYTWEIYFKDDTHPRMNKISELEEYTEGALGGSFQLAAEDAIKRALKLIE